MTAKEFLKSKNWEGMVTTQPLMESFLEEYAALKSRSVSDEISQVRAEIIGMHSRTCGVSKFDYELGANEALDRLRDLLKGG